MFIFVDDNMLTSAQLNGNFGICLDKTTGSAQSVASMINLTGGATTTSLVNTGATTLGGALTVNPTVVAAAGNYVVSATDQYVFIRKTTSAATQVFLPSSPTPGRVLFIKDAKGDCAVYNILVTAAGTDTIDGLPSITISTAYASVGLVYIGGIWLIL